MNIAHLVRPPASARDPRVVRVEARLRDLRLLELARQIARRRHVRLDDLLGDGRSRPFVEARHELWRAMHDEIGLSWPVIAGTFEKRHDGISHAGTERKETRAEATVLRRLVAFIRELSADATRDDVLEVIGSGAWRGDARCVGAPSCPRPGNARYDGRCYEHRRERR